MTKRKAITYESSGVSIEGAERSVQRIKSMVRSTFSKNVLSEIGLFGGFFNLDIEQYRQPVLVSSIDGVGTKLKIAFAMHKHDTIGEDLVNHCVNDVMTSGAEPLFFLDYLAVAKLDSDVLEHIVEGMVRGCRNAGCALIGGETAEMPGFYGEGEYDVAGVLVGILDRPNLINGSTIAVGDVLLGLPSNGLHTNGYSLAREIFFNVANYRVTDTIDELGGTLGEELLKVHRSYAEAVRLARGRHGMKAIVHVTGGGIEGNTARVLPEGRSLDISWRSISQPPIFHLIQSLGGITDQEMRKVFNLGVGEIFIVSPDGYDELDAALRTIDYEPFQLGSVV